MSISLAAHSASEFSISGPESISEWRKKHTLPVPGHEFTPRFRKHQWDGYWAPGKWCRVLGSTYELRCSRGLVPRVIRDLGGAVNWNVASAEEIAEFCTAQPEVAKLRDYQRRALEGVLREGWGRVAYATNAGKGAVIALLARFCERRGEGVLILCDEIAVFDALEGELKTWAGTLPGVVRSGIKVVPPGLISLAMVPTLVRRLASEKKSKNKPWTAWVAGKRMVLCDEADKADSASWKSILSVAKNSQWRAGFSGSFPDELFYDLKFDELMGPIIDRVTNAEMVERGVSARPSIEVHAFNATPALKGFPASASGNISWWDLTPPQQRMLVYDTAVGYNQERHYFVASLIRPDTPTAVVVNRVEHGRQLTLSIPGAVFLDGSSSENERLSTLDDFQAGRVNVIVVTKILDRGTNRLGVTADLIFASGEGSATQILQRLGRGLRRAGGKETLRLVDIVDRVRVPEGASNAIKMAAGYLHAAARKRLEVYASEGFDVELVSG